MSKQFVAILVAIVVGLGAIFWFTRDKTPATSNTNGAGLSNHVTGENKKGVTLVEYGDFQCPACYSYESLVEQVRQKYAADIHVQFRNFPLSQIHKNAIAGARAAEAADKQHKYWEMHDKLYAQQDPNGKTGWVASTNPLNDFFVGFAQSLGLNTETFKQDFASSAINDTINADIAEGQKLGITGTPTFFLQGKKVEEPPRDVASFSKIIDAAITAAQKK